MTATQRKRQHTRFQPTGAWCRRDKRLAIFLRDGFRCLYCWRDLHGADPQELTLDHVITRMEGGSNDSDNVFLACKACNCRRRARGIRDFCSEFDSPGEVLHRIRCHCRRKLDRYRRLARAILDAKGVKY